MKPKPLPPHADLRRDFIYDSETGVFARPDGYAGYTNQHGYRQIKYQGRIYYVSRLVWKWMTGEEPPLIDHIDRTRSNNRWINLRIGSYAQNNWNRGLSSRSTTGIKGVTWIPERQKFRATIYQGRRVVFLRYCGTAEEAASAVAEARRRLHGEFAHD